MTIKELKKKRDKLQIQINKLQEEIEKKSLLGYRVFCYGDKYDYGSQTEFLIKEYGKRGAIRRANNLVLKGPNGGHVDNIYPWNKKYKGRVH